MNNQPTHFSGFPPLKLRVFQTDTERRFALLIFAILSTSLYIFHTILVLQFLSDPLSACLTKSLPQSNSLTIDGLLFACSWQPDLWLILGLVLGEVLVFGFAILIYWLTPAQKCKWEHLKPLQRSEFPAVLDCLEDLRQKKIPAICLHYVRDPLSSENPEVFGSFGTYYLSIPNRLILLFSHDQNTFRNIVLHEMAHFYNKDVGKASLAKAISYSFIATSLFPFMLWLLLAPHSHAIGDTEFITSEFWGILPLAMIVFLLYQSILRSREVYADMQALQWSSSLETMVQVIRRLRSDTWSRWQTIFRSHPNSDNRILALREPQHIFRLNFWEAFGIGITFATAFPTIYTTFNIISQLLWDWLLQTNYAAQYPNVGTLLLCLFAVPIIGQMIWRARIITGIQQDQELHGAGRFGLCLAGGMVLGFVGSFFFTPFIVAYHPDWPTIIFYVLWTLLFTFGVFSFCKWLALLGFLWLEVVRTETFFRLISIICFAIAGIILAIGLTLFINYSLVSLGSFIPSASSLNVLENPLSLHVPAAYFNVGSIVVFLVVFFLSWLICLVFASFWVLPLFSHMWYRKRAPIKKFQWALNEADSDWQQPSGNLQSPFRFYEVVLIAAAGSLLFCGVLLYIHQGLLSLMSLPELKTYGVLLAFSQLGLAALFQAGVALIIMVRTRSARIINGLLGAFLSGCVMVSGTLDIYRLFGGSLGISGLTPSDTQTIFLLEVNWGTLCTLGIGIVLGYILRFEPDNRSISNNVYQAPQPSKRKWPLLISIPCLLLIIAAIFPHYLITEASEPHTVAISNTSIIQNGDFEEPVISPNTLVEYSKGQSFQNWVVASGSVDLIGGYWISEHGAQSIDLDGSNAGTIYQDVPTSSGASYTLSFYLAGNPVCAPAVKKMQVKWGSTLVATVSFNTAPYSVSHMGWKEYSYSIRSTGPITRLSFVSLTQSLCGPALDNVVING